MSDQSTNLSLPFLAAAQAQKHVTHNEALLRLDALVQCVVVSATTSTQPASPTDGSVYVLPPGKTGAAWGGMSNYALAYYVDGAWSQITPREGWLTFIKDTDALVYYTGSAWNALSGAISARLADIASATYAQGNILYFNGSNLTVLAPGTSGQFLKTNGAGANPAWATPSGGGGGSLSDGDYGDIVVASSGTTLTIDTNVVSNTKLRQSAGLSVVGRGANSTGNVADITAATDGHVLRLNGTTLAFGTLALGAFGANVITYAKIQQVSATNRFLGRITSGAGDIEELTAANAKTILALAQADIAGLTTSDSPQLTAINLGHASDTTVARASAGDISVEGNVVYRAGGTDVPVADGGTGASTAASAATNLGLGTGDSPQFTAVNVGHVSDTTVTRVSSGVIAVEGSTVAMIGTAQTWTAKPTFSAGAVNTPAATPASGDVGYLDVPQNSQSSAYTFVMGDAGKSIFHPASDTTPRTWTIPANASVAYPIGTAITVINDAGAGSLTLAIASDTLRRSDGTAGTGSRTIAASATATIIKTKSTEWHILGAFS